MPASSERKASVAPREAEDVDIQLSGDPSQLTITGEHAVTISTGYRPQKAGKRRQTGPPPSPMKQVLCAVCRQKQPMVDLDATTECMQCEICQRWIQSHCAIYMDQELYVSVFRLSVKDKQHSHDFFQQGGRGISSTFTISTPGGPEEPKIT